MNIEQIAWNGWENCYKLSNGKLELIVTGDVGPRVLYFGLVGGENVFYVNADLLGQTGGEKWVNYGGHRLWHAPEDPIRTYQPDNSPVSMKRTERGVEFIQPIEALTGIRKSIAIQMADDSNRVQINHYLFNAGDRTQDVSVWGLSVMAAGGVGIFPLPERGTHPAALLPNTKLIFWPYSDLSDPRWAFGREFILLRQDSQATHPQKIGGEVRDGWLAYANFNTLFIKKFGYTDHGIYPDLGCNAEIFTNHKMLEVESLSCMHQLEPNKSVNAMEEWSLFADVPAPQNDADVKANIIPLLQQ